MDADPWMDYQPTAPDSDEEELDLDTKEALRLSREQYYSSGPSGSKPSFSPNVPSQRRRTSSYVIIPDSDDEGLCSRPPRKRPHSSRKRVRPSRIREDLDMTSLSSPSTELDDADEETPHRATKPFSGSMSFDQLLKSSRLNQRASAPVSDAIDGDM